MGGNTFNLRVQDLTFGRDHVTTTQAHVTAVTNASLTLRTPKGFPTFDKILSNHTTKGADSSGASRFKMNAVTGDCELVAPTKVVGWPSKDKRQIGWNRGKPRHNLADDTWTLSETEGDLEHYAVGTLVGVKSSTNPDKATGSILATTSLSSRCASSGTRGEHEQHPPQRLRSPPPEGQCLATNGGGPQLGSMDKTCYNASVTNHSHTARATMQSPSSGSIQA
jgi:hypothetical protein